MFLKSIALLIAAQLPQSELKLRGYETLSADQYISAQRLQSYVQDVAGIHQPAYFKDISYALPSVSTTSFKLTEETAAFVRIESGSPTYFGVNTKQYDVQWNNVASIEQEVRSVFIKLKTPISVPNKNILGPDPLSFARSETEIEIKFAKTPDSIACGYQLATLWKLLRSN